MSTQGEMGLSVDSRKRHCWECLRRRLVCDSVRPVCRRCCSSGVVCPGYDDSRPLKWLAPGRIKSRSRKSERALDKRTSNRSQGVVQANEGSTSPKEYPYPWPLLSKLESEAVICLEAAEYYNSCIYPDLVPIMDLGPNDAIFAITTSHLADAARTPIYFRYVFVCMAVSHRINQAMGHLDCNALIEKLYSYRGIVIRALREDMKSVNNSNTDLILAGILSLLLVDAQQGASSNWLCHIDIIQTLISMRGGLSAVVSSTLDPVVLCFLYVSVLGSTTSPASSLEASRTHIKDLDFIMRHYGDGTYQFYLFPPPLFAELIRINHIRAQAAAGIAEINASQEAYDILARIREFSPGEWASCKPSSRGQWELIGRSHHAATMMFCISSLQSLEVLPQSDLLRDERISYGHVLYSCLREALSSPRVRRFVLWPLLVLGMEAACNRCQVRDFVWEELESMSSYIGTNTPLVKKALLKRFWASGDARWDSCFDKPYLLITPIAIDVTDITVGYVKQQDVAHGVTPDLST